MRTVSGIVCTLQRLSNSNRFTTGRHIWTRDLSGLIQTDRPTRWRGAK